MSMERRNSKDDKSIESSSSFASMTPLGSLTIRQRAVVVLALFLCLMAVSMTSFPGVIDYYTHSQGNIVVKVDDIVTVPLQPKKEFIMGLDHYYMLPKAPYTRPEGILIVLHSCKRSGLDFFHLPEDRIIAQDAIQKGFAILALTSQHRESGCFTQSDLSWVGTAVDQWSMLHALHEIPRVGLAMSSGAAFLFFVHQKLNLQSMAIYNSPQTFLPSDVEEENAIPTVFVTMSHDKPMAKYMHKNYELLLKAHVPAQLYRVSPHPFTSALCMGRFPEMLSKDCDEMFRVLQKDYSKLLDNDGFVVEDLASGEWQKLFEALQLDDQTDELYYLSNTSGSGHSWVWAIVEQEVRACQAYHGMTAEHHSSVLDFLLVHRGIEGDADNSEG